jgi:serine/threonine-protein kinase RsbW
MAWLRENAGVRGDMVSHRLALVPDIAEIPRLLDWVEQHCRDAGIGAGMTCKIALALEEATANVINHAFGDVPPPHRVEVGLEIAPDRIVAEVVDNGCPFDPTTAPAPDCTRPLAERDPGGLGLHLMHKMMDRVGYRRTGGENHLRLEKSR